MAVRGWRHKSSPESGTGGVPGASDPGEGTAVAPDVDAGLGTDMTAVTGDIGIDPLEKALAERATLIQLCMYAMDRARSAGVVERLSEGLRGIGVLALRPDGTRFDPAHHEAGGTTPTDDPELDGVIAETEVLGFADRDRVLRAPVVTVYQLRAR
ncbi:nucleotide exchange factor GrpE [Saccharopolyspora pogona]|uniref:nucleotide exchange factor GrpE n=1 Tax=Saccharopolyspora pogona TaxID=333966 RepID=UPI001685B766